MSENDHKGVLINGRTPEAIKTALRICTQKVSPTSCRECPYKDGACLEHPPEADALALIEYLEGEHSVSHAPQAKWIEDEYHGIPCVCSYCSKEAHYTSTFKEKFDYDWNENLVPCGYEEIREYVRSSFCPQCGARMDGEEDAAD